MAHHAEARLLREIHHPMPGAAEGVVGVALSQVTEVGHRGVPGGPKLRKNLGDFKGKSWENRMVRMD